MTLEAFSCFSDVPRAIFDVVFLCFHAFPSPLDLLTRILKPEADEKPSEVSREERVEERRLARVDKEQRMSRSLGGVQLLDRAEQLVASPFSKEWRRFVLT